MNWGAVLNTGANLYQAGVLSSLSSTQNQMLAFQIDQNVSSQLRQKEIIETRRLVVQLTGIIEDSMDYITSHTPYAGVIIPICAEFAKSLRIDEGNFDEASDMVLARSLKRAIRKSRSELAAVWDEEVSQQSEMIGKSLTNGQNVEGFTESWIPDQGELLAELYSLIIPFQEERRAANAIFEVHHIRKSGSENWFRVDDDDSSFEIGFVMRGFPSKMRVVNDEGDIISSDDKVVGWKTPSERGNFVLPNGSNYQYIIIRKIFTIARATITKNGIRSYEVDMSRKSASEMSPEELKEKEVGGSCSIQGCKRSRMHNSPVCYKHKDQKPNPKQ